MRPQGPVWVLIAGLVVTGCDSSPPSRFYTLSSVPPEARLSSLDSSPAPLVLGKLTMPSILDRPEIATRLTATRVEFSEVRRWAAPLEKLVRQILAEDLSERTVRSTLASNSATGPAAARVLTVEIDRFDADPAGKVMLDARWAVTSTPQEVLTTSAKHTVLELQPKATDADDVASTMSEAVAVLADDILARSRSTN